MLPGEMLGSYKIVRLVGQGGMGEVYLAMDQRLNRQVALKVISEKIIDDPSHLARFRREAPAAAALNHPNICAIYDVGEREGRPYIAMEYVDGQTLRDRIGGKPLDIVQVRDIAVQIADALEEAGEKDLVHRDIKSANILLTHRNQVKLLDFGLAKFLDLPIEITEAITHSQPGLILGTVDYMSPEQLLGNEVDNRADIFSFGVVLYEMLTGNLPFAGKNITETIDAVLHLDPIPITNFNPIAPASLCAIVSKMLRKDRDHRYQTAGEIKADLLRVRTGTTQPFLSTARGKNSLWAIAALVVFLTIYVPSKFKPGISPSLTETGQIVKFLALPCKVYGSEQSQYLSDAIPNSISTLLGRVDGVETRVPPTSFEMESVNHDLRQLSELYGVPTFVMSSITAQSDKLILDVQIVDASTRKVLWSNQYEGSQQNYIDLIREAANGIRKILRPNSSEILIAKIPGVPSTSEAEIAFRQGKYYVMRYSSFQSPLDFDAALRALTRALDLEPELADAAAEVAYLYQRSRDPVEAQRWAQKALQINNRCGKAWGTLAGVELFQPRIDLGKLMTYALRGAAYSPDDAVNQMGLSVALSLVSDQLSLKAAQEAHRLDPLYPYAMLAPLNIMIVSGQSKEAVTAVDELLHAQPNQPIALFYKSLILAYSGNTGEAAAIIDTLHSMKDLRLPEAFLLTARHAVAIQSKQYKEAESFRQQILTANNSTTLAYHVEFGTPLLVRHGKIAEALEVLNHGFNASVVPHDLFMINPDLKAYEKDPRFEKIISGSHENYQKVLSLLKQSKERGELPAYLENHVTIGS